MAAIILPHRRTRQPQGPVDVEWSSSLSRGLVNAISFAEAFDVARRVRAETFTAARSTADGYRAAYCTAGATANFHTDPSFGASYASLFLLYRPRSWADYGTVFGKGWFEWCLMCTTSGVIRYGGIGQDPSAAIITGSDMPAGKLCTLVFNRPVVGPGTDSPEIYVNGRYVGQGGEWDGTTATGTTIQFGQGHQGNPSADADYILAYTFRRALKRPEARALHENPWQLFRPYRRKLYSFAASGGSQALEGTATGSIQAAANLAVSKVLEGAGVGAIDATAALAIGKPLAGAATLTGSGSADLTASAPPQFLRPDGNVTQTSVTGGFAEIDESSASDADFAYGVENASVTLEVSLSNPSGTPNSGTCTVRYRIAKVNETTLDGGGATVLCTAAVYQGATQIAFDTERTATGSWTQYSFTFNTSAVSNWNDLRLRFTSPASGGNTTTRRAIAISWAEIEVPAAGAQSHALQGAAVGGATAAGALALVVPLAGAATGAGSAAAALNHVVTLSGAAITASSSSGAISLSVPLAGAAVAGANASGELVIGIALSADAIVSALASAALSLGGQADLAGGAVGGAAAAADIAITKLLTGSATGGAGAGAALTIDVRLAGDALAAAVASGALTAIGSASLAGAATASAAASGALSVAKPIAGAAAVAATGAANLAITIPLTAAALAAAQASGALTVTLGFSGAAITGSIANAALSLGVGLQGAAIAGATASAAFPDSALVNVPRYTVAARARRVSTAAASRRYTVVA